MTSVRSTIGGLRARLLVGTLLGCLGLSACQDRTEEAQAQTPPTPPAAALAPSVPDTVSATAARPDPQTDPWLGRWTGVEGTFLDVVADQGQYSVTVSNLDGPRTFPAERRADEIEFERDGVLETVRQGNGEQTGMKWLADKTDCLVVRTGEGYCR